MTTDKLSVVTQALVSHIDAGPINFQQVYFGDEQLVPRTPAVAVNPDPGLTRTLYQTGHQTSNTFDMEIYLYHAEFGTRGVVRKETLEMAEQLMDHIHTNRTLGGLLVHSYVKSLSPGYALVGQNTWMHASKLGWEGINRTMLGAL